jgi:hypothetical protein
MPYLAALLVNLFGGLLAFFGKLVAKRYATAIAFFTGVAIAFGVMVTALTSAMFAISAALPAIVSTVATWVVPDNVAAVLSARFAASIALFAWRWQFNIAVAAAGGSV